jgi:transketolase
LPGGWRKAVDALIQAANEKPAAVATRVSSQQTLNALAPVIPELFGGSADLTGSNNTNHKGSTTVTRERAAADYVHYGVREFGMTAIMNGIALHRGLIPFGGTFLVFSDYARNAVRMAALMKQRNILVYTHDSIGLGEDGPTHQPVEHLTSLRLIPNLDVYRPCDVVETAECWELALQRADGPGLLALSRQNLPQLRLEAGENRSARGGYAIREAEAPRQVVLLASGSEVEIAVAVRDELEAQGIGADVVSMPCWERFDAQDAQYKRDVLPAHALKVSIEAGTTLGWERYTGLDGLNFGVDGFGASGPYLKLYEHYGLTAGAIVPQIIEKLNGEQA